MKLEMSDLYEVASKLSSIMIKVEVIYCLVSLILKNNILIDGSL